MTFALVIIVILNQYFVDNLRHLYIKSMKYKRFKFDYLLIILLLMLSNKAIVLNYFSNSLFIVFYINYSILISYLN